jgi:hypothetical protein
MTSGLSHTFPTPVPCAMLAPPGGLLLGYEPVKARLHHTQHPNALPASERCPGQLKSVVSRVCFNSARPVRLRSSARENHSSIAEASRAIVPTA